MEYGFNGVVEDDEASAEHWWDAAHHQSLMGNVWCLLALLSKDFFSLHSLPFSSY